MLVGKEMDRLDPWYLIQINQLGVTVLKIEVFKSDKAKCRVELSGRLDTATAVQFDENLATIKASDYPLQIIDLAGLSYLSSAGVRSLFRARKVAQETGGQFLLVNPQPQIQKVFDIIKALPNTAIFVSESELDNYLLVQQTRSRVSQ